jgi:hypothetical protein
MAEMTIIREERVIRKERILLSQHSCQAPALDRR